jgi:ribosome biogenesis GTPase
MNVRKREKRKFVRVDVRLRNCEIDDDDAYESGADLNRKAEKKAAETGTRKSDLVLKRGRVLEVRTNHVCLVDIEGEEVACTIGGRLKQINFETRTLVAVGDFVSVDVSHEARIEEVEPRGNTLSRFSENEFQTEAIIAANVDQVVIVAACVQPDFKAGLVDRYLCAARIADIEPVLCINKIDLVPMPNGQPHPAVLDLGAEYEAMGIAVFYTSAEAGYGLEALAERLHDAETVFSGHSGVGKTALLCRLQPDIARKMLEISESTGKGKHSTTYSRLIRLDGGGFIVDTPGIRTFGLHRRDRALIPREFPGFDQYIGQCRFADCTHTHEVDCAVKSAMEAGDLSEDRYESYLRIWESLQ